MAALPLVRCYSFASLEGTAELTTALIELLRCRDGNLSLSNDLFSYADVSIVFPVSPHHGEMNIREEVMFSKMTGRKNGNGPMRSCTQ